MSSGPTHVKTSCSWVMTSEPLQASNFMSRIVSIAHFVFNYVACFCRYDSGGVARSGASTVRVRKGHSVGRRGMALQVEFLRANPNKLCEFKKKWCGALALCLATELCFTVAVMKSGGSAPFFSLTRSTFAFGHAAIGSTIGLRPILLR
jgi:hypothetical protein